MLIEVKVPVLPESVAEATLVNWHKQAGEAVRRDENLIDIETDKVVLELPAPDSGVLKEIKKADGSTVTAQEVIAVIDTEAKATNAGAAPVSTAAKAEAQAPGPTPSQAASTVSGPSAVASTTAATALPSARKMMAEQNVGPAEVAGTGRGGRVTKGDVLAAVENRAAPAAPAAKPPPSRRNP